MLDYHSHTYFSGDSPTPMSQMIEAAIKKGVTEYAITDHYDPDYPDNSGFFELDFENYQRELLAAQKKYADKIKIVKGIEIGIQTGLIADKCRWAVSDFPYDFVLGSFHCFDGVDTYMFDYDTIGHERSLKNFYLYTLKGIKEFNDFDILGHINVIDRYIGAIPNYSNAMEVIEEILKLIIEKQIGLEINTSSYKYGMGERTMPTRDILKLYKDLGGEILSIGSDAHLPKHIGDHFAEAYELARSCGFKYQASFNNRKLSQKKFCNL
ncbi:MAG: histidinol-phosphatase HisJ family protein [Anaerovoracaceae bacterium]